MKTFLINLDESKDRLAHMDGLLLRGCCGVGIPSWIGISS